MKKVKTIFKALCVILLFFVTINLTSCDKKNDEEVLITNDMNGDFYQYLKKQCQQNPSTINGIELYTYNNNYYFDNSLLFRSGDFNYNYLLVFKFEDNKLTFVDGFIIRFDENTEGFEVDYDTLPAEYNNYLEAKEKGKKKVYTSEEIEFLKNNF